MVEERAQLLALDELERDEEVPLGLTELEQARDVRVLHRGRDARLVDEHRDEVVVLGDRRQDALERDERAATRVASAEDLGHAAGAQAPEELVMSEGFHPDRAISLCHETRRRPGAPRFCAVMDTREWPDGSHLLPASAGGATLGLGKYRTRCDISGCHTDGPTISVDSK